MSEILALPVREMRDEVVNVTVAKQVDRLPCRFQIGDAVIVTAGPGKQKRFDPFGKGGPAVIESVTFTTDKVYYGVHGGMADACDVEPAA